MKRTRFNYGSDPRRIAATAQTPFIDAGAVANVASYDQGRDRKREK